MVPEKSNSSMSIDCGKPKENGMIGVGLDPPGDFGTQRSSGVAILSSRVEFAISTAHLDFRPNIVSICDSMTYHELNVLVPSHSLEDFPTELGEKDAASLLNAFAVLWHPLLLASAKAMPNWHRADDPPDDFPGRLVIVPTACDDWIPGGWVDRARREGAVVVSGLSERQEILQAAIEPLTGNQRGTDEVIADESRQVSPEPDQIEQTESEPSQSERSSRKNSVDQENPLDTESQPAVEVDAEIVADFLALGTCYLQMELLTRHMHHFSNVDEVHLQREAVSAAEAALAGDHPACRTHLQSCFDVLLEARERFYPVDCFLVDLCLLIPRLADEQLAKELSSGQPVNILVSAQDLEEIGTEKPEIIETLRKAWEAGTADVTGGELTEAPTPLLSIASVLWEFQQGHQIFQDRLGRVPTTWSRRRFGFSTQIPQIINKLGYHSALHIALDDGIYPDAEQSKIRWEGCDGTVVDAMTRIPLAADSATSYLRFAQRMAESMEEDQVAALILARWPEVSAPWFEDLRRMHRYAPCLGRFVTLHEFFELTETPGRLSTYKAEEYLSPFLVQTVAQDDPNPISRFSDALNRRHRFDAADWYRSVAEILLGRCPAGEQDAQNERIIEQAGPDAKVEAIEKADWLLTELVPQAARRLTEVIVCGGEQEAGYLLLNSLSFPRRVSVPLPALQSAPSRSETVKGVQFDDDRKMATVDIPAAGFAWIPASGTSPSKPTTGGAPMAEENVLRNEFFEVYINDVTGGIRTIKGYGRRPNRLSQQLAFRFPRERTISSQDDTLLTEKSYYSEMRCLTSNVSCAGPALGEIVTTGEIVDQDGGAKLAGFRQTVRIWRGRPVVEVDVELDIDHMPEGDPWSNYYAARFAWNDSAAALTRSVQQGAHGIQGERFESPHYLEIADDQGRTTILFCGLPFHRKTGMRMLDTLLVTAGETKREFRFVIAVDVNYPMQAAIDVLTPVAVVPTELRPRGGTSGWFFHLNAKNVQISRIFPLCEGSDGDLELWEQHDRPAAGSGTGFALRLMETEGRSRYVAINCFKTPTSARQRDFRGLPVSDLKIEDDKVLIDMAGYEIVDVELRFES